MTLADTRWAALGFLLAFGSAEAGACTPTEISFRTDAGETSFAIEIADDPDEQSRGLMFRRELAAEAGMLFVYDPPQPAAFWMKNTFLPLDMIFIDDSGRVESVAADTVPFSLEVLRSEGEIRAVLEVNAGLAAKLGIGPGIQAVHPAFAEAPAGADCRD